MASQPRPHPPLRINFPWQWLAAATLFLIGFRVGLNIAGLSHASNDQDTSGSVSATVTAYAFLVELGFLNGRAKLPGAEVLSLIRY